MTTSQWIWLTCLATLWGSSYFFIAIAVREIPPFTLVACRVGLAALILFAITAWSGHRFPRDTRTLGKLVFLGFASNALPFCLITWAEQRVESSLAAIILAAAPMFTLLIVRYFGRIGGKGFGGKLPLNKFAGVALGLIGILLLFLPRLGGDLGPLVGQGAVLVAALSYAIGGVFARRFDKLPPMVTATVMVAVGAFMATIAALVVEYPGAQAMRIWIAMARSGANVPLVPSWAAVGSVLGLAVFNTAVAYLIYFRLMPRIGPANMSQLALMSPPTSVFLGVVILGEKLTLPMWIGTVLIVAGLFVNDGRMLPLRVLRDEIKAIPK